MVTESPATMMDDTSSSKWAFMRVWWDGLQRFLQFPTKPRRGSLQVAFRGLAVYAPPEEYDDAKNYWTNQRDALELLLLQRTVDQHAFMEAAREHCSDINSSRVQWGSFHPDEVIPCRVEIWLNDLFPDYDGAVAWTLWLLSAFLEPVATTARSESFQQARAKILELASDEVRQQIDRNDWAIPVTVNVSFSKQHLLPPTLEHIGALKQSMNVIETLANDTHEEKRRVALRGFPFRATRVDLKMTDGMEAPTTVFNGLDRIVLTDGLHMHDICYYAGANLPKQLLGELLRKLMCVAPKIEDTANEATFELVDAIRHGKKRMDAMTLAQYLSALRESRFNSVKVSGVLDEMKTAERRIAVLWMVHSLFSATASLHLTSVELGFRIFSPEDIAVIRTYVEAKNPVALLCLPSWRLGGAYDPETQPRKCVAIREGARVSLSPSRTRRAESMPLSSGGWFEVIQEDSEFVDVIVPAFGQCRVLRNEVTEWQVLAAPEPRAVLTDHSIKSLKIWSSSGFANGYEHSANIVAFLQLVGQPLESLEVGCSMARFDEFLDELWPTCPNLQTMRITSTILPTLDYFVEAYESGRCTVPSLELGGCAVDDISSRVRVFKALEGREPLTKMASVLREFSLSEFTEDEYDTLNARELAKIAKSLYTNQNLRFIGVSIGQEDMDEDLAPHQALFTKLDGQLLKAHATPMPIRHKCALLSVFKYACEAAYAASIPAAGQLAQLDSHVLTDIMAFAASPVKRSISLRPW